MSIHTEYIDSHSPSLSPSRQKVSSQLYQTKLKNMIETYHMQIKENIPAIQKLENQSRVLKKIYNKQKQKLEKYSNQTLKMLTEDYQREIDDLNRDKHKMHEMLISIQDESDEKIKSNIETIQQLESNEIFISQNLQKLKEQNSIFQQILKDKQQLLKSLTTKIKSNNQFIQQKQKIERKYENVVELIRQLQKSANHQKQSS